MKILFAFKYFVESIDLINLRPTLFQELQELATKHKNLHIIQLGLCNCLN